MNIFYLFISFVCHSRCIHSFIHSFMDCCVAVAVSDELEGNTDQINFALNINSVVSSKQKKWESGREANDFNADWQRRA